MKNSRDQNISVLPPALEASRRTIHKKWVGIMLVATLPGSLLAGFVVRHSIEAGYGVLLGAFLEAVVLYAFVFVIIKITQLYIQSISKEIGYVCPHCGKSLFQPTRKGFGGFEVTGLCPSCKTLVIHTVDAAVVTEIEARRTKSWNMARKFQIVGAVLVLIGIGGRYLATTSDVGRTLTLLKENKYDLAIREASAELGAHPHNVNEWAYRGIAYMQKGMKDPALRDFNRAIALNPDNFPAVDGKCELDVQMQAYNIAIADCSRAISLSSGQNFFPYIERAGAYYAKGRYGTAEDDMRTVIKLKPDTPIPHVLRGALYLDEGRLEDARRDLQKAGEIDPNALGLFGERGELEVLSGDNSDAISDLSKAIQQMPSDSSSILWLHNARYHAGQSDSGELEKMRAKLTDANWLSTTVDFYAGKTTADAVRAQAAAGDADAAAVQFCQAAYFIGEYYLQQNDRDKAKANLLSAANSCPQNNSAEKQAAVIELKAQGF